MIDDRRPHSVNAGGDAPAQRPGKRMKRPAAAGQSEVIVRVTGRAKSARSLGAQFTYNTRGATLPAVHSSGQVLTAKDELRALQTQWVAENGALSRHPTCQSQSVGIVLSMPAGTESVAVMAASLAWAHAHLTPRTEWLAVQHRDKDHPHVHIAARAVQHDGRRIEGKPAEIQRWREAFAHELQRHGVQADATPRREKVQRALARQQEIESPPRFSIPSLGL